MMTGYPAKTRSAAVGKSGAPRKLTTAVDGVTTTKAPMHGSAKGGKSLTNRKGLPHGK